MLANTTSKEMVDPRFKVSEQTTISSQIVFVLFIFNATVFVFLVQ